MRFKGRPFTARLDNKSHRLLAELAPHFRTRRGKPSRSRALRFILRRLEASEVLELARATATSSQADAP